MIAVVALLLLLVTLGFLVGSVLGVVLVGIALLAVLVAVGAALG